MLTCLVLVGQGSPTDRGNALKGGQGATPAIRSIHGLDARRLHRLTLPKGTLTLTARIARDTRATLACLASHAAAHQSTPGSWLIAGSWLDAAQCYCTVQRNLPGVSDDVLLRDAAATFRKHTGRCAVVQEASNPNAAQRFIN